MAPALGKVVIPSALYNAEKANSQPYGSREVRASQVLLACQNEYTAQDVLQVAAANPGTDGRCDAVLAANQCEQVDDERLHLCRHSHLVKESGTPACPLLQTLLLLRQEA